MSIETMKQALEALDEYKYAEARTALRQAIEQAQKQEPRNICERWNIELDGDDLLVCFNDHEKSEGCRYERYVLADTSPPQRQPLTDEQIQKCYETTGHYQTLRPQDRFAVFALARAIEQAHGIKE